MKIVALVLMTILLSGCFHSTKPLVVQTKPIERIPLVLPEPDQYHPRNIEWIIITPENAEEVFARLKKEGKPVAIIGVTGEGYKVLALNNGDKLKLIKQLKAQIEAYRNYYIAIEKRDKAHNEKLKKQEAQPTE